MQGQEREMGCIVIPGRLGSPTSDPVLKIVTESRTEDHTRAVLSGTVGGP